MAQAVQSKRRWTEQEYLAFERSAETKHEFFNGEIFAMSGATRNHSYISTNLTAHLVHLLRGRCTVFNSDLRLKIQNTGLYTYPDAGVVCGRQEVEDDDLLLNPTLLAEVLSESTEGYDRGTKFKHYETIPSLTTYLLVSQDEPQVEQFVRLGKPGWEFSRATGLDSRLELPALGVTIILSEIYANITFPPRPLRKGPSTLT